MRKSYLHYGVLGLTVLCPATWNLAAAPPVAAEPAGVALGDGTLLDRWTLPNGLCVVARHVPGARAAVVTVGHSIGSADDPPGREGLGQLTAEVVFTGAAADAPERSRKELVKLRPLGWNLMVFPRITLLTEMCTPQQLPGVLHQVAGRMAGVQVTSELLRSAKASVRADFATNYSEQLDFALHFRVGDLAWGRDLETVQRMASGESIAKLGVSEVENWRMGHFVPDGATLSVVGDFSGIDLRRFIDNEFASIPGGLRSETSRTAARAAPPSIWSHEKARGAVAVVGVTGPAITDTLHPAFFLTTLVLGSFCSANWDTPEPPLASRFRYAITQDPNLVRFYPPISDGETDPKRGGEVLLALGNTLDPFGLDDQTLNGMREQVRWLLGGALPPVLASRASQDASLLLELSTSAAARSLMGDDAFWSDYRNRFEAVGPREIMRLRGEMLDPKQWTLLLLTPNK